MAHTETTLNSYGIKCIQSVQLILHWPSAMIIHMIVLVTLQAGHYAYPSIQYTHITIKNCSHKRASSTHVPGGDCDSIHFHCFNIEAFQTTDAVWNGYTLYYSTSPTYLRIDPNTREGEKLLGLLCLATCNTERHKLATECRIRAYPARQEHTEGDTWLTYRHRTNIPNHNGINTM